MWVLLGARGACCLLMPASPAFSRTHRGARSRADCPACKATALVPLLAISPPSSLSRLTPALPITLLRRAGRHGGALAG